MSEWVRLLERHIQRDSKSDVCYRGSWIWFASTLGACLADFTVFGIIRLHRAGTQIETEEYFPSQRRGKQTLHRKHSADAVQIQHRCTAHTVRLTDTQTEGQMNEQTGRKKETIKPCAYKHDYKRTDAHMHVNVSSVFSVSSLSPRIHWIGPVVFHMSPLGAQSDCAFFFQCDSHHHILFVE